jgi:hypothetical protein
MLAGMAYGGQAQARGGAEKELSVGDLRYRIHTFTNSGTLTVTRDGELEYLIVAGGGGGGALWQGGGGGAGGFLDGNARVSSGSLLVTVGVGGTGGGENRRGISSGGNSSIKGIGVAVGGGFGASEGQGPAAGGSGGGGAHGKGYEGAAGTDGQGYAGGKAGYTDGAGGGGAGGPGKGSDDPTSPRAGGAGRVSSITGCDVTYATGGAGHNRRDGVNGKNSGPNTGDGGEAGAGGNQPGCTGGNGGSGIVIVRYKLDIHNRPVSNLTTDSATFNAFLVSTSPSPTSVCVLWGEEDGAVSGAWAHTNGWKAGAWGENSRPSTNISLIPNRAYHYTFRTSCATTREVADTPVSFITGAVEVKATHRVSTEEKPAAFVISRPATATNGPLAVYYALSGTGINGTDYDPLTIPAIIPSGAAEVRLSVVPNFNMGETRPKGVELTLAPGGYLIGVNNKASIVTKAQ